MTIIDKVLYVDFDLYDWRIGFSYHRISGNLYVNIFPTLRLCIWLPRKPVTF